jgi:hypothetical protein
MKRLTIHFFRLATIGLGTPGHNTPNVSEKNTGMSVLELPVYPDVAIRPPKDSFTIKRR